jgi:hypothetical protein
VRSDVAALYVDPRGPYPGLVERWYDEARDARTYDGPWPVVAHPPCGPWGRLRHLSRYQDPSCGPRAVEQVRLYGGVLEHPERSLLWVHCDLPRPGELPDGFGGITIEVCQVDYGHVARKRTWLYLIGVRQVGAKPPAKEPTHWVSGGRNPGANASGAHRGYAPAHVRFCSSQQRRRTPIAFAQWLLELASKARRTEAV